MAGFGPARARIEQIVSNLLDNAVKFTPAGKRIAVSVHAEGESAIIRVADEGEGLAAGMDVRIFDLFVQGERGLDRSAGGPGVGLALVNHLTELHGGTVLAVARRMGLIALTGYGQAEDQRRAFDAGFDARLP